MVSRIILLVGFLLSFESSGFALVPSSVGAKMAMDSLSPEILFFDRISNIAIIGVCILSIIIAVYLIYSLYQQIRKSGTKISGKDILKISGKLGILVVANFLAIGILNTLLRWIIFGNLHT